MSRYQRADVLGGSYFFTVVTELRQPLLSHPEVRLAMREAIESVRWARPICVDGWVLLPDHYTPSGPCPRMMPLSPRTGA